MSITAILLSVTYECKIFDNVDLYYVFVRNFN